MDKIPRGNINTVIPEHTMLIPNVPTGQWINGVCELEKKPITGENLANALETIANVMATAPVYPSPEFMLQMETIKRNAQYDDE